MELKFLEYLNIDRLNQKVNSFSLSLTKYEETIKKVKRAKNRLVKEPSDYKLLKRFDVLEVSGVTKLIVPVKVDSRIIYFVHDDELFPILNSVHLSLSHGGRDRMMKELRKKYKNITYKDVSIFLSLCEPCLQKQKRDNKEIVVEPLLFKDLNSRCQVDLIDYQLHEDDGYKFIMVYQDYLTKFVILKGLKSKKAEEVADNLIDIFTLLGAPAVLQSNDSRKFVNQIIDNLKLMWPELRMVRDKPLQSQNQKSGEHKNQDIKNMVTTWMRDNKTSQWSKGLRFVQFKINKAFHSEINRSPYEALFGQPVKLGLTTLSDPQEILTNVQNKEQIQIIINSITPDDDFMSETEIAETEAIFNDSTETAAEEEETDDNDPLLLSNTGFFFVCTECQLDCTTENYKCISCGNYCHQACCKNSMCARCDRKKKIEDHQVESLQRSKQPAKKMKILSDYHHPLI